MLILKNKFLKNKNNIILIYFKKNILKNIYYHNTTNTIGVGQ
jgi:hypothetical protein